jgi:DNA-binding beta-propeller fold protein YncE
LEFAERNEGWRATCGHFHTRRHRDAAIDVEEIHMHLAPVVTRRVMSVATIAFVATFTACDRPATEPTAPLTASAAKGDGGGALPTRYVLPGSSVFPEGVAFDQKTQRVFVSSTTNGTIFAGDASDETLAAFLAPGGDGRTTAIGLDVDDDGHLFVAGGATGLVFVYDANTGALIERLSGGSTPTFINDIAVDGDGVAYITDSMSPVIYRIVPDGAGGYTIERWLELAGTPIVYTTGFNLNGIVVSSNGRYLFTIQSNTGRIYRIDTATKEIVQLDVGGTTFPAGDGLWLHGNALYVLQNQQELITELRVQPIQANADIVGQTTDESFRFPTSLVIARGRMLVVNSQFDRRATSNPVLPFTVSVVPVP